MKFQKGQSGNPKGKPKGAKCRFTLAAKDVFQNAFNGIGGEEALIKWAKENPTEFYKMYSKLIPVSNEHTGKDGAPIQFQNMSRDDLDMFIRTGLKKLYPQIQVH